MTQINPYQSDNIPRKFAPPKQNFEKLCESNNSNPVAENDFDNDSSEQIIDSFKERSEKGQKTSRKKILKDFAAQTIGGIRELAFYPIGFAIGRTLSRFLYPGKESKIIKDLKKKEQRFQSKNLSPYTSEINNTVEGIISAAAGVKKDLLNPPVKLAERLEISPTSHSAEAILGKTDANRPYQSIDEKFIQSLENSGWQGQTIFAGGEDIKSQSILAWFEEGERGKTLNFSCKLTPEGNKKILEGFKSHNITEGGGVGFPKKEIKDGVLFSKNITFIIPTGRMIIAQLDEGTTVQYNPIEKRYTKHDTRSSVLPYSAQGTLNITINNADSSPQQVEKFLNILGEIGLDNHQSTPSDLEYTYLRKMIWAMNSETPSLRKNLSKKKTILDKIAYCQDYLSEKIGIPDVTKVKSYDWQPKFDSIYKPGAGFSNETKGGWAYWHRFDADTYIENELKDFYLNNYNYSENPGKSVVNIINATGSLIATEERFSRLGKASMGFSSVKDRKSGGASYVFTHLSDDQENPTYIFSKDLLRRCDQIAFTFGKFGDVSGGDSDKEKVPIESYHRAPIYEVMFEHTISLPDYLERINVKDQDQRKEVIDAFREAGFQEIRGKKIEDIVNTTE